MNGDVTRYSVTKVPVLWKFKPVTECTTF